MKVLIIGDIHFKISNFAAGKSFLSWIESIVQSRKIDMVVNLGDTMDSHAVIRAEILGEYTSHITNVLKNKHVSYYTHILGNHEFYNPRSSYYHAIQSFRNLDPRFIIADKPNGIHIENMSFVPYHPEVSTFPRLTKEICFAHQTFVGADFGHYRPDYGVDMDNISADLIISGHVHKGQTFGKVFYPGSPFAQSVDDVDQIKGIYILDTNSLEKEFIKTPLPNWRSCSFTSLNEEGKIGIDQIHSEIVNNLSPEDYWIITIHGFRSELTAYLDSPRFNELRAQLNFRLRVKYLDAVKHNTKIQALSPEDAVCQYIDKLYSGDLDKQELKELVLEVMR